jgi:hypothetical protein
VTILFAAATIVVAILIVGTFVAKAENRGCWPWDRPVPTQAVVWKHPKGVTFPPVLCR